MTQACGLACRHCRAEAIPEDQRGWVKVTTHKLDGRNQMLIEVIDSGTGIPQELHKKIFNLFFTTKGKKGTGIGLASARKTIEAHGGSIELAPQAEGEGAHFMIYLPITPPEAIVPVTVSED
jgi:two-component system nitrogen regulation sensor histidine kinase NtrY